MPVPGLLAPWPLILLLLCPQAAQVCRQPGENSGDLGRGQGLGQQQRSDEPFTAGRVTVPFMLHGPLKLTLK